MKMDNFCSNFPLESCSRSTSKSSSKRSTGRRYNWKGHGIRLPQAGMVPEISELTLEYSVTKSIFDTTYLMKAVWCMMLNINRTYRRERNLIWSQRTTVSYVV